MEISNFNNLLQLLLNGAGGIAAYYIMDSYFANRDIAPDVKRYIAVLVAVVFALFAYFLMVGAGVATLPKPSGNEAEWFAILQKIVDIALAAASGFLSSQVVHASKNLK